MVTSSLGEQGLFALSVIIAARNEEAYLGACLDALLAQQATRQSCQVIVAANACDDRTVEIARSYDDRFAQRGWHLTVLDLESGGKLGALNAAEAVAQGHGLVYLDADVICDPELLPELEQALATDAPRYATGTIAVARAKSWVTRAYARIWTRLPFVQQGAVGAGLFALNRAGRARWQAFPPIISDDTFVRLNFAPSERIEVPARYHWPMVEGLRNLIRVRRRQDRGVAEVHEKFPELIANETHASLGKAGALRLLATDPIGMMVYLWVHVAVRLRPGTADWTRGR